uniref:TRPM tetramerisation domain-containing protein n=1 Tax=Glossina brevipalpis TaxID=37001 RepID=A0A1A9WWH9_9MUSC
MKLRSSIEESSLIRHWVTPITMSMYLLIANILLINLLIAVFNNIFNEVNSVSHQVQRDNGLKLFLEKDDLERLYDFEEECVEGFFHEQEIILNQSTEERVKNTTERVETMAQKIEDINQKENLQTATVQNIEFRLRKMEESSEQILAHLAVIHRFMSMHTIGQEDINASNVNLPSDLPRVRTISMSDNEGGTVVVSGNGGSGSSGGAGGGGQLSLQINNRRRFNRSLTEVRPDAYIFDEGTHFEVVPVPEETEEMIKSKDSIDEQVVRKISVQSESDSDVYVPLSQRPSTCETIKRTPYVTVRQDTGASTESKDTLTPLGHDDDQTLVGENSDETGPEINFEAARHRAIRQRTVSLCRRNSETCSIIADMSRSHISLNQLHLPRRQLSLTQSEPESDKEGATTGKAVLHPRPSRNILLKLHSEYTSITDELESVCHMIASPTVSLQSHKTSLDRPKTDMSKAEFAALLEKQHLKECEENDYMMLEGLFQARTSIDDTDDSYDAAASGDYSHRYPLRRETAIELSPSKPTTGSGGIGGDSSDTSGTAAGVQSGGFQVRHERPWQRNSSMEQQQTYQSPVVPQRATSEFLNPPYENTGRLFKKSSESLQKNSSTDTDYSAHPYRFIKQSSNDTTTSMTGSYNVDTPSLTAEPSLEAADTQSQSLSQSQNTPTVLESGISLGGGSTGGGLSTSARYQPMSVTDTKRLKDVGQISLDFNAAVMIPQVQTQPRALQLKKQFSLDQGKQQPAPPIPPTTRLPQHLEMDTPDMDTPSLSTGSGAILPTSVPAKLLSSLKPPLTSKLGMNILKESSSSTEESKDGDQAAAVAIPQISTHLIQDEIAKLSSNIKSSTESEKDPPYNETMC